MVTNCVVKTTIETTGNTDICLNFLIHYRGICSKPPCYCIVMEFCLQGALYDVLRHKDQSILPPQVVSWSRQIASGMQFLHSHRIIHRDLKSPKYVEFTYKTLILLFHIKLVCGLYKLLTLLSYY